MKSTYERNFCDFLPGAKSLHLQRSGAPDRVLYPFGSPKHVDHVPYNILRHPLTVNIYFAGYQMNSLTWNLYRPRNITRFGFSSLMVLLAVHEKSPFSNLKYNLFGSSLNTSIRGVHFPSRVRIDALHAPPLLSGIDGPWVSVSSYAHLVPYCTPNPDSNNWRSDDITPRATSDLLFSTPLCHGQWSYQCI